MICFDFDGVIADSLALWLDALRAAARGFSVEIGVGSHLFRNLRPLTFERLGEVLGIEPKALAEAMSAQALADDRVAPLFAGMEEVLARLAGRTPLAIVSSSRPSNIKRFLDAHQLNCYFQAVHGSGDGRRKAEILVSLKAFGAHAMVGDAASDIDAAKEAGMAALGVSWGWQDKTELAHADMILDSPAELYQAICGLLAETTASP